MVAHAAVSRSTLFFLLLVIASSTLIQTHAQRAPSHPRPIPGDSPLPPLPQTQQKNAIPISPSASTSAAGDSSLRSHSHSGAHLGPVDPDARSNTGTTWKGDSWEELPSRWKDYLPRAVGGSSNGEGRSVRPSNSGLKYGQASSPAGPAGYNAPPSVSPPSAKGTVKVASKGPAQQTRTSRPAEVYDEPDESEDEEDDDEEDDEDEEIWRAYREKKEEEALLRRHLKSRARQEALRAGKSARRAAKAVLPNNGDQKGSTTSSDDSHHSLMDGIKALWSTFAACFGFIWYSVRLCTRYTSLFTRFIWSALRFSLRHVGRAFLLVWATGKYAVRQVLRPLRVVGAPVVYLFLGVKWTFWDWPSYYVFRTMREVYPLYVFLGAALALGTAIGLSSSVVLYLGSFLFNTRSPLESHLSSWQKSEISELDRRLEVGVQKGAAAIDSALGAGGAIGGQAKKSRRDGRSRTSKRSSASRAGAEESLIDKAMRERAQGGATGPSPPRRHGTRSRTSTEDVQEQEEELPDFLKGLGSSWKPLPRARETTATSGLEGDTSGHTGPGTSTTTSADTTGEEEEEEEVDENGEPEDYFSVPPATQRRYQSPSLARSGSGGGGSGGLSPYTHHQQQQQARPAATFSAYSSALPPGNSYRHGQGQGQGHGYGYGTGVSPLSHPAASGSGSGSGSGSISTSSSGSTSRRRSLPSHSHNGTHNGSGSGIPSPPAYFSSGPGTGSGLNSANGPPPFPSPLGLYGQPISSLGGGGGTGTGIGVGVGSSLPVGATGRRSRGVHAR
ncbi:hypothetical protein BCV69DRAFT_301074 [Microstroma glucosiphilum]|uniref:Uncharacterized protein n=1 Tax=Pseudomicrostroma glucosiphilum TaxID=1684307 RepID=A0A316U146_9BASI|nr:hypothetical protein BCV69DRAFT_301074 [Pseudomicrostroma glucosiphilum]PWN18594.1 hypothetical protein BCV69DRAFT_301074 [Pseudomicrostroma glucosiphilum]